MPYHFVSVVITAFNRAQYIEQAIDSVLAQDYPRDKYEIIVIDDGSTDDTAVHLRKYGDDIRYYYQQNCGLCIATQAGIEKSKGELVALLDSDDYWYPHRLKKAVAYFSRQDVVAVLNDLDILEESDGKIKRTFWEDKYNILSGEPQDVLQPFLDGKQIYATSTGTIWRKSVLDSIMPFPDGLRIMQDVYLIRHAIFFGKICGVREALGVYRIHLGSQYTSNFRFPQIDMSIVQTTLQIEAFEKRCRDFGVSSHRRQRIQQHALAELYVIKHLQQSRLSALDYVAKNLDNLGFLYSSQLVCSVVLPKQLCGLLNRYFYRRFGMPV